MSASDFRDIVVKDDNGKAERLFRASVSAFCSLTRPSRREVSQLDDLTLPLFDQVSVEARRYVAAALSECAVAPAGLVARLADDRVDVAAPLLIRSALLADIDLIGLIGRHGLGHARAIARRPGLNPTILQLVRALEASAAANIEIAVDASTSAEPATPDTVSPPHEPGRAGEEASHRLRTMMRTDAATARGINIGVPGDRAVFGKLRDTAFTGNDAFFQTALADALGMTVEAIRPLVSTPGYSALLAALRALDLGEEQAFMITVAIFPSQFPHPEAIRMFVERYRALDRETALERVRGWKLEMVAHWIQRRSAAGRTLRASLAANTTEPAAERVRAS